MSKVLEVEPFIDETLELFTDKLDQRFVSNGKVCQFDEWLGYCKLLLHCITQVTTC